MKDDVLVKVEGVSKKFCRDLKRSLWYGVKDISSELFGANKNGQLRPKEFWAVDDVSFELKRGECLGLIGHNGAGKSTLLKMLNGLIKPDKGSITMKGRIGALIELGSGFNPILTGRENIYNNGAVLGFSKKEIDAKFDAIVEFAEIGEFLDTPVQNYSSGMKVRLGFAVASQMEPDVLIIDEVLAVGDVGFRAKCFGRIGELQNNCAVIFVSHAMNQVSRLSTSLIHLSQGKIEYQGNAMSEGINQYLNGFTGESFKVLGDVQAIKIEELLINNVDVNQGEIDLKQFEQVSIDLKLKKEIDCEIFRVGFSISDQELKGVATIVDMGDNNIFVAKNGMIHVNTTFENYMAPGKFYLAIHINKYDNGRREFLSEFRQISALMVTGNHMFTNIPIHIKSKFTGTLLKKDAK